MCTRVGTPAGATNRRHSVTQFEVQATQTRVQLSQADWRDESNYASLLQLERSGFAWEWLRRRNDYRDQALEAVTRRAIVRAADEETAALAWNLHRFEDPRLAAPLARPIWAAPRNSWVVDAAAERSTSPADCLDLHQLDDFAKLLTNAGRQQLLLSDGYRSIRIDIRGASVGNGPVGIAFTISGLRELERSLIVLRRLRSLIEQRRFVTSLYPPVQRARRLVALLRTFDALVAGARHAEIAEAFASKCFKRHGWRTDSPTVRSQVQRLVRTARRMAEGGFWSLLE